MAEDATAAANGAVEAINSGDGLLVLERERDAWATIRGFTFQADLSIERWIDLGDTDILELERGEDIDAVAGALAGDPRAVHRLLEQVKHREANLTLRTDAAKAAIANFFEHRRLNPLLTLSFRFTTTAEIGRERESPLPGRMPGISAWQAVERDSVPASERDDLLNGLLMLLRGAAVPTDFDADVWYRFQSWVGTVSAEDFHTFAKGFSWAVAAPDATSLREGISARLRTMGHATSEEDASRLYEHLFATVFHLLSAPGIKRLTRADLLVAIADVSRANGAVEERLHELHDRLARRVASLEDSVAALADRVTESAMGLAMLSARVLQSELGLSSPDVAVDVRRIVLPPLSAPPTAPFAASRKESLDSLLSTAPGTPKVLAIYGAQASGKSQFALQAARRLGDRIAWIPFLGLSTDRAAERLDAVVATAANSRSVNGDSSWEAECSRFAEGDGAVVLDDVPSFRRGDELCVRLAVFAGALASAGRPLILTSVGRLASLDAVVAHDSIIKTLVPTLTSSEVLAVMIARGAPPTEATHATANLIQGITNGHPVLVQAVSDYVGMRGWDVSGTLLFELFGNRYAQELNEETIQTLLGSVSDADTRALLYRLTLADLEFERDDVSAVASIAPSIERSTERLASVVGPWIEVTGAGRYRLSQLIRAVGPIDVSAVTQQGCHGAIGVRILGRRHLSETDALSAFSHFSAAHRFDDAALLLIRALYPLSQLKDVPPRAGRLWSAVVVPPQATAALRLQAHAFQAVVAKRSGGDFTAALDAANAILAADASLPAWAAFASAVTLVIAFALDDAMIAAPFMHRALVEWPKLSPELRESLRVPGANREVRISSLAWLAAGGVRHASGMVAWLAALGSLPSATRDEVLNDPLGRELAGAVFSPILIREWEKPEIDRRWGHAVSALQDAGARARQFGAIMLDAGATGCAISCLFEAGEPTADIAAYATECLKRFESESDAAFIVAKHMALGTYDRRENELALDWLRIADGCGGERYRFDRLHVQVRLSALLAKEDPAASVAHGERGVAIASLMSTASTSGDNLEAGDDAGRSTLVLQALAELATAKWVAGDRVGAAKALAEVVDGIVAGPVDDDSRRALAVRVGHATGYFVATMKYGAPPAGEPGGSSYIEPYIGMFVREADAATASLYDEMRFRALGVQAMTLAEVAGDHMLALQWAHRSASALKAAGLWAAATVPLETLLLDAVERHSYAEAFGYAEDMLTAVWANRKQPTELFKASSSLKDPSPDEKRQLDATLVDYVFLPSVLRLTIARRLASESVQNRAIELRDVCQSFGDEQARAPIWGLAVALVGAAFVHGTTAQELFEAGKKYSGEDERTLRALAYFLASLHPGTRLEDAIYLQLNVAEYLVTKLRMVAHRSDEAFISLVDEFWRERFDSARFRFQNPRLAAADLKTAREQEPTARLKAVLTTIARGLGVTIPEPVRRWLALVETNPTP